MTKQLSNRNLVSYVVDNRVLTRTIQFTTMSSKSMLKKITMNQTLGELEQKIMMVFWSKGPLAASDAVRFIRRERDLAYTTILTIMNRLVAKGLLCRDENQWPHQYKSCCTQEEFMSKLAGSMLKKIRMQFGDAAVAYFIEEASRADRKNLKKFIRDINKKS